MASVSRQRTRRSGGDADLGFLALQQEGAVTVSSVGAEAARGTADWVDAAYRFVTLVGAGHFATDEQPEAVTDALLEHLAAHPA